MNGVHIYRADLQPATSWTIPGFESEEPITCSPKALCRCWCCGKRRRAENAVVAAYYDQTMWFCAPGKGCKSAAELEAKRRRAFRNRSRAQKRRWRGAIVA